MTSSTGTPKRLPEFAREVDGNAARLARRRIPDREDRIAEVDGGAQLAGGRQVGRDAGGHGGVMGVVVQAPEQRQDAKRGSGLAASPDQPASARHTRSDVSGICSASALLAAAGARRARRPPR